MSNGYGYGGGGQGRGMGRGRGRGGQGMGRGRGNGRGQGPIPLAASTPLASEPRHATPQLEALRAQAQDMMEQLGAINQRIVEIEATRNNQSVPIRKSNTDSDEDRRTLKMTAVLDQERCMNCAMCVEFCPEQAINMNTTTFTVEIDSRKCTGCGSCVDDCPGEAISLSETARRAAS